MSKSKHCEDMKRLVDIELGDDAELIDLKEMLCEMLLDATISLQDVLDDGTALVQTVKANWNDVRIEELMEKLVSRAEMWRPQRADNDENNGDNAFDDDDENVDSWVNSLETKERDGVCKMCGATTRITLHHTIPKLYLKRMKNGKAKFRGESSVAVGDYLIEVCRPCHNEIHRLWKHNELAREFMTIARLLEAPELQPWIAYQRKKNGFVLVDDDDDDKNENASSGDNAMTSSS
jgi:hypothetical protein